MRLYVSHALVLRVHRRPGDSVRLRLHDSD